MAKDKRPQTGGLQEKKVHVELTKEEVKTNAKEERAKRKERARKRREERGGILIVRFFKKIREIFGELKKVNWPTFPKAVRQTGIVLSVVFLFSIVVLGIDKGLGELFKLLTKGLK